MPLINRIDEITNAFRGQFGELSTEQLNWKPDAQTWSIAQNIDHLIVTNETYWPAIADIREGRAGLPWTGRLGFMVRFFEKTILGAVQPDRRRRMKTFPVWEPSASEVDGDILQRFYAHQESLKQLIRNSQDLVDRGALISSPANRFIVYPLATAFDIIVTHESRHLEQAKEVLARLKA